MQLYRPLYHFSPPQGWQNDPNGLVYFSGEYHLFYQHHPHSAVWGPMHWGHAVSADLLHWEHLPIALYPDAIGTIWSGSAVVDADNTSGLVPGGGLVAMFSYDNQSQGIAYSTDKGRTWKMYAGNPVIPTPKNDFRDPKVFWYAPRKQWSMVLAHTDRVEFYASPDLTTWTQTGEFGVTAGSHGGVWECPDLFPLTHNGQTHWVLLVSVGNGAPGGGNGIQYFIGSFDGTTFTSEAPPEQTLWFDYGTDNYAGVTYNNVPGDRRIYVGWMSGSPYASVTPTDTWRGAMTVPRELSLRDLPGAGLRLVQRPIAEFGTLRTVLVTKQDVTLRDESLSLPLNGSHALDVVIEAEVRASAFEVRLRGQGEQVTTVAVYPSRNRITLDRRLSGKTDFHEAFPASYEAPLTLVEGRLRLRVLVDASSMEVFAEDGAAVFTCQIFPDPSETSLELMAVEGEVKVATVEVYELGLTI